MTVRTTVCPRVWTGCLSCYNGGCLVGEWHDAEGAAEVAPEDLHGDPTAHEELWCMDIEGFPRGTDEMSPSAASQWGELFDEVGEVQWPALLVWIETGCYVAEGAGDLPSLPDFEDAYRGEWDSFAEYAAQLVEDIGLTSGWPEEAQRYFSWEAWARDLRFDYTVADAPEGGVYVFRGC